MNTITRVSRPVTVTIEGIADPARFTRLQDALPAIWESLRRLPLGSHQYESFREFFGEGAVDRVEDFLQRDGQLTLTFAMAGQYHAVRITPVASR